MNQTHEAATQLLGRAIAGHGTVGAVEPADPDESASELELRHGDGTAWTQLRLVSWPAHFPYTFVPPKPKYAGTLWVLHRAPRHLLEQLRAQGHNFVDVSRGAVRLAHAGVLIDRTDLGPTFAPPDPQRLRDPFADRASLVARTLFREPDREWGTRELAQSAGVSPMLASHVVRQLAEWDVVSAQRHGRDARIRLRSEQRLIDVWTTHYDWRKNPQLPFSAPMGDPLRFLRRVPEAFPHHRWALTLQAGASLIAPHASWDKLHVYVDVSKARDLRSVGQALSWSPDSTGRVVLMQPCYDDAIWTELQTVDGLPVVSTLQLILDLWHYPVRGREQAEHLLDLHRAHTRRQAHADT